MLLAVTKCFTSDAEKSVVYSFASGVVEAKDALYILKQALSYKKGSTRENEQQRASRIKARFDGAHVRSCAKRMRLVAKQVVTDIKLPTALNGANAINTFDYLLELIDVFFPYVRIDAIIATETPADAVVVTAENDGLVLPMGTPAQKLKKLGLLTSARSSALTTSPVAIRRRIRKSLDAKFVASVGLAPEASLL